MDKSQFVLADRNKRSSAWNLLAESPLRKYSAAPQTHHNHHVLNLLAAAVDVVFVVAINFKMDCAQYLESSAFI